MAPQLAPLPFMRQNHRSAAVSSRQHPLQRWSTLAVRHKSALVMLHSTLPEPEGLQVSMSRQMKTLATLPMRLIYKVIRPESLRLRTPMS